MSDRSTIEWTDATWNPVRGCSAVSPGCTNCYAAKQARRQSGPGKAYEGLTRMTAKGPRWTGVLRLVSKALEVPLHWKRGRLVFVNSMSDLFHEDVPDSYIEKVFAVMAKAKHHQFQVLTKRAERLEEFAKAHSPASNVWLGVSVESAHYVWRVAHLRRAPAHLRFLSVEPMLGPIPELDLRGIHWVIVGGESGPKSRPMNVEWVREVRDRCLARRVPFFFKQWGGFNKKRSGRELDGRTWDEMPQ